MTNLKQQRHQKIKNLAFRTWTWVATLALATFGPVYIWDYDKTISLIFIGLNFVNGIIMILANKSMFSAFDELEKKIHLEAMALTLGLTMIVGLTYTVLETTRVISGQPQISILVIFMSITYIITLIINKKRYQ